MRLHLLLISFLLSVVLLPGPSALTAQGAGDLVALNVLGKNVLVTPRAGGPITTLQTLRQDLIYGPMMAGPGDDSALLVATYVGGINRHYVQRVDAMAVTTLSSFMIIPELTVDMGMDDAGDLLLLTKYNHSKNGLYSAPFGVNTLQLVAAWPKGAAEAVAFTEDHDSGDWWVLDESGYIHRIARAGGAVLSITRAWPTSIKAGDLVMDPATGHLIIAAGYHVLRFDPVTRILSTLYMLPYPLGGAETKGMHFDQQTRGFLASGWHAAGPSTQGVVVQLDAMGTFVRLDRLGAGIDIENVFAAWGRAFTPLTSPVLGQTYEVALRSRPDAGLAYCAALSFHTRPGISTPWGHIPLRADALFFLSFAGVPLFRGFSGTLDTRGGATMEVDIPGDKLLSGLRIIAAFAVMDSQGIRRILGPFAFSLR